LGGKIVSTPEGKVKDKLKKYLTSIGAWHYWPVSNGMGRHGIPDCIACYKGFFISVETKKEGGKCTALQLKEGAKIITAEGFWTAYDGTNLGTVEEYVALIDSWEKRE